MQTHFKAKKFFISLLLFFLCTAYCARLFCQDKATKFNITVNTLTPADGLASREVFCAIQDNYGFMWFGTRNGLNRYDGKNFKLFTKRKDGLAENKIIQLAKDNDNHLFIVYGNPGYDRSAMRIEVMDLTTYKVSSLKQAFPALPFDEKYVYWVANGGDDLCFLVSNPFRYWRLSAKGFKMMCEMKDWDLPSPNKEHLLSANGNIHTTTGPFCQFYKDCALLYLSDKFPEYFCAPRLVKKAAKTEGMLIDPQRQLAFSRRDVYHKINQHTKKGKNLDAIVGDPLKQIYMLNANFPNALVYTPDDGLFLYDFTSLSKLLPPEKLNIFSGYGLYSYFMDNQNNIWVCTAGGLLKIKLAKDMFTPYFTKEQMKDSSDNQARGIYSGKDGNVYAAIWTKLYNNNGHENKFLKVGRDNVIYGVCRNMGKIYVGEANIYLAETGRESGLKKLTTDDLKEIWSIDSLAPGRLLVGSTIGVFTFNVDNSKLTRVLDLPGTPKPQFVYRFIRRKDKKFWVVAQNGLFLLNEKATAIEDYFGKASEIPSHRLPFELLHDAYEDGNGVFWFATNGEGLFRWSGVEYVNGNNRQTFRQFNSADGLPSDILYRIESVDTKNLWISTDNGLTRFNTTDFKTHTYITADGISHNEFNRASSFKAEDGRLFFGGLNGINAFYPKDFAGDSSETNVPLRLVSLNQFEAAHDKLVEKTNELLQQNIVKLNPGDKFFILEFQLLDFEEGKHQYAYRIEGIDKDWNYISENFIRISGLPYGNFKLRIKGQNSEGAWSKNELNVPISVITPFYKTRWFYLIIVCCLVVLVYGSIYFRTRTLEKANARLEAVVIKRTVQLQDSLNQKDVLLKEIHHRVKNNLQVISSMLELQAANAKDDLLKQALIEGQTRVGSIALIHHRLYENENLGEIEFGGFLEDLYKQVAAVFQKDGQQADIFYTVQEANFDIDTIVPLGLLVNELFTNSFKYAFNVHEPGKIWVQMAETQQGNFIFTYTDSGPGLPENFNIQKASSLGLRLIYRLGKQLGGNVSYDKEKNTFTIKFKDSIARKQDE